ncbi:MAG: nitroreductase family protein [Candidatus Eisenbacteria bacterium]|jgi:nitroreductase|nr:nitroreductase family protein [Candidatus Eisenbacteria bacterium]
MTELRDPFPNSATLESIAHRHSVRLFTDMPVPDAHITAILRAANQAPSAHNAQSWRFVVVRGEKKKDLAHLVTSRAAGFPRPASTLLRMAARSIISAPVVIAVANTGELIRRGADLFGVGEDAARDFFRTMEIQNSAAAVENLLVAATSLGLATVWLGVLFLIKGDVLALLGEAGGEFMAVVPVGFAAHTTTGPRKAPLESVVRFLE